MIIDKRATTVIEILKQNGHKAFLVGGCVRDYLLGKEPKDWDVATSAMPNEVLACFSETPYQVIETGLKHGTVSVIIEAMLVEVTTFRKDGEYLDNRHPSDVVFITDLHDDLARRDFTMNALAYDCSSGIIDYYGGETDLSSHVIRAVGEPSQRLTEDALRILRALRFSSILSFDIEPNLSKSIHENKELLSNISPERISAELSKMILGNNVLSVLLDYPDVFSVFIPEISSTIGFEQKSIYHKYDVWTHISNSVNCATPNIYVRLTMLLHDLGKPSTFSLDENGQGHFYKHSKVSEEIALCRLKELRFDNNTITVVTKLVRWHDAQISSRNLVRWLNRLGEEILRLLLEVKKADASAQSDLHGSKKIDKLVNLEKELDLIIANQNCYKLTDLAVSGNDIHSLGVEQGPKVGIILNELLNMVMDGELENDKRLVLIEAQKLIAKGK